MHIGAACWHSASALQCPPRWGHGTYYVNIVAPSVVQRSWQQLSIIPGGIISARSVLLAETTTAFLLQGSLTNMGTSDGGRDGSSAGDGGGFSASAEGSGDFGAAGGGSAGGLGGFVAVAALGAVPVLPAAAVVATAAVAAELAATAAATVVQRAGRRRRVNKKAPG